MAISAVNQTSNTWFTGTAAKTLSVGINNLPGQSNILIAVIKTSSNGSVNSITDPAGNTWTNNTSMTGSTGPGISIFSTRVNNNYSGGQSFTLNFSTSMNYVGAIIEEFYGIQIGSSNATWGTYGVFNDQTGTNFRNSTSTALTLVLGGTTFIANELIVTGIGTGGTTAETFTTPTGFTALATSSGTAGMKMAYKIVSATGTYSHSWSWNNGTTTSGAMASFAQVDYYSNVINGNAYIVSGTDLGNNLSAMGAG